MRHCFRTVGYTSSFAAHCVRQTLEGHSTHLVHLDVSTSIEVLTPIWQRVLQRPAIRVDENFFDLGGDSSLALKLFTEISEVFGRKLAPVMIYQAPTIAALAAALEQPEAVRFPPLMQLKAGTKEPPIFIAHGMGGNVMDFFQVVKHIRTQHPIYGMQAKGIEGVDDPLERIEDMAQFFLDPIRGLQSHGPYLLIGYSLGGLVALEIAQRLLDAGEKAGLLVMLESYPHKRYLSAGQRLRLIARRAKRHAAILIRLPWRDTLSYIAHPAERLVYIPREHDGARGQQPNGIWFTPAVLRMRDRAYLALRRYRPRYYPGKIKFVKAETISEFPDDPAAVWTNLAKELEIETVPGDHLGIVNTHYERLAAVLSRYLQEAIDGK